MPLLLGLSRHPRADRSFRYPLLISGLILLLLAVQATQAFPTVNATTPAADTTSQLTSTVMTNHFSVYFVYPTSASPGQSELISANTTATSSVNIISFSIDISSYVNGQPMKLASQTILGYTTVQAGAKWRTLFTVNIPAGAQAGSLIGTVTEIWQQPSGSYYSTPYSYMPYYTQNYGYYAQNYGYYSTYNAYPYQTYNTQQNPRYPNGYNTYPNNNLQYKRYPNGFTVLETVPESHMQSESQRQLYMNRPSFGQSTNNYYNGCYWDSTAKKNVCGGVIPTAPTATPYTYGYNSYYYVPNYVTGYPMYSSNYATQVTSQLTVTLTYVT